MDGNWNIMLSKISQTRKVKNHVISLLCGIQNWKQQINKQKLIDTDNSMVVGGGGRLKGKGVKYTVTEDLTLCDVS